MERLRAAVIRHEALKALAGSIAPFAGLKGACNSPSVRLRGVADQWPSGTQTNRDRLGGGGNLKTLPLARLEFSSCWLFSTHSSALHEPSQNSLALIQVRLWCWLLTLVMFSEQLD